MCALTVRRPARLGFLPRRGLLPLAGALSLLLPAVALAQTVSAFPGAEGEGMYTTGGRGGSVYHVTNLNNSGAGSLRDGISTATGARTIVFDVSGTIVLGSTLRVNKSNITIAGQTAPGMGICLLNYGMSIQSNNVVVRHVRVRPGDIVKGPEPGFHADAFEIKASGVIIDHCSTSWGIDENLSCAGASFSNVTVQYCIISEGLDQTGLWHDEWEPNYNPGGTGHHSMGSLIKPISGSGLVSYHHNLWSQNGNRNPAVGTYTTSDTLKADIRNNVMYNNRNNGYSSGASLRVDMNYVGNYVIAGYETDSSWRYRAFNAYAANNCYIYQSDNKVDGDRDTVRDGSDTGWSMFAGTYTKLSGTVSMKPVTTHTADQAYSLVMNGAGAFPWARDSVDQRLIRNVNNMTGSIIDSQREPNDPNADPNGYPTIQGIPRDPNWDTDLDGMPNAWETWYGTNPASGDNNGTLVADGYTNLEKYLAWKTDQSLVYHPGDTGGDNAVSLIDLGTLAINWGLAGKGWHGGDFNNDGTVELTDLGLLAIHYGWSGTPPSPTPVPEPASLVLMGAGIPWLVRRRQMKRRERLNRPEPHGLEADNPEGIRCGG